MWFPQPKYRYVFRLRDGTTILADPRDVVKTINKRERGMPAQRVFEVKHNGMWRELWPEDIISWDQEALPGERKTPLRPV